MAKVVVIDDRVTNRNILTRLALSVEEGLQVQAFASPIEALTRLQAANPPDLITLDVMMPGMNGADVSRKLKSNPATAKVPIIMLTALHEKKYIKAALLQLGVDYYIVKPFEIVDFLNKVREALEGDPLFE